MQAVKRVLLWIAGVFCGLMTLGGVLVLADTNSSGYKDLLPTYLILTVLFAAGTFYFIQNARGRWVKREKVKKKSKKEQQKEDELNYQAQRRMQAETATVLPVVDSPISIVLKPGEVCHYQSAAVVLILKNQVVGRTGGHSGISVRVAKGLTLHSGGSRGQTVREDVPYTYPGILTITNQRVIMTGEKAFEIPMEKLTAVTPFYSQKGEGGNIFQSGKTSYTVVNTEPYWIPKIISLLNKR